MYLEYFVQVEPKCSAVWYDFNENCSKIINEDKFNLLLGKPASGSGHISF